MTEHLIGQSGFGAQGEIVICPPYGLPLPAADFLHYLFIVLGQQKEGPI